MANLPRTDHHRSPAFDALETRSLLSQFGGGSPMRAPMFSNAPAMHQPLYSSGGNNRFGGPHDSWNQPSSGGFGKPFDRGFFHPPAPPSSFAATPPASTPTSAASSAPPPVQSQKADTPSTRVITVTITIPAPRAASSESATSSGPVPDASRDVRDIPDIPAGPANLFTQVALIVGPYVAPAPSNPTAPESAPAGQPADLVPSTSTSLGQSLESNDTAIPLTVPAAPASPGANEPIPSLPSIPQKESPQRGRRKNSENRPAPVHTDLAPQGADLIGEVDTIEPESVEATFAGLIDHLRGLNDPLKDEGNSKPFVISAVAVLASCEAIRRWRKLRKSGVPILQRRPFAPEGLV